MIALGADDREAGGAKGPPKGKAMLANRTEEDASHKPPPLK